jgi:16S rRNA (adenine1518-N6/adenine1519-N6)-dimethyltransferase
VISEPRPRRSLGQCFLTDQNIAGKIVALAQIRPSDRVVEIGPGRGILTRLLAQRAGELVAIEIDQRLHAQLSEEFSHAPHVRLIHGDALEWSVASIPAPYKIVANLPYYVSTPILFHLLAARAGIASMVLMLQREVVDRMVAKPGSKAYGPLSLALAFAAETRKAFTVPATCFHPRPAVESAVVVVTPRVAPAIAVRSEATLFRAIRAAFAHRRKTLSNALKDGGFPAAAVISALAATGVDAKRRGETLSLDEFGRLADALGGHGGEEG